MIGENVEIVIVSFNGSKVRLGINAPKNISVHRKGVYEAIELEKSMKNYPCKKRSQDRKI